MRDRASEKRLLVRAIRWSGYKMPAALASLNRAGIHCTAAEVFHALKVFSRRVQKEPITFHGGETYGPGRNSLALRMGAALALLELQRRGYAG